MGRKSPAITGVAWSGSKRRFKGKNLRGEKGEDGQGVTVVKQKRKDRRKKTGPRRKTVRQGNNLNTGGKGSRQNHKRYQKEE